MCGCVCVPCLHEYVCVGVGHYAWICDIVCRWIVTDLSWLCWFKGKTTDYQTFQEKWDGWEDEEVLEYTFNL